MSRKPTAAKAESRTRLAVGGGGGGGGSGGAPPVNSCGSVGARSKLPVPSTSGFAKPSGTVGGFRVINWAGFKGAISFTFDDAVKSQRDHYAELNQVGVPMTFYLVSANDASSPVWTTAANDGHELGNHSAHHCSANGTNCAWGAFTNVDSEMDDCTAHIKTTFGVQGVYTFAAPNGDGNWGIPASTRFMLNRGISDAPGGVLPNDSTDPFNLPCHMAATGETASGGFNSVTDSVRTNGSWRVILSHSLEMDGTWQPVLASEVVAAMTYAKGLGDVWTDTMVSVGAYWRGQKALSTVQPVTTGTDKVYSWTLPAHFPPGRYLRVSVTGGKVTQCGTELTWDDHGYYEVSLDAGSLTISP